MNLREPSVRDFLVLQDWASRVPDGGPNAFKARLAWMLSENPGDFSSFCDRIMATWEAWDEVDQALAEHTEAIASFGRYAGGNFRDSGANSGEVVHAASTNADAAGIVRSGSDERVSENDGDADNRSTHARRHLAGR